MPTHNEDLNGRDLTIAIAVSRFNSLVTERLLAGALEGLAALGVAEERTTVAWVPGRPVLRIPTRRRAATVSLRPTGPKSFAWLFARFATSTP